MRALLLTERDGKVAAALETIADSKLAERLPDGEVTVAVDYSTLNYKDGLILKGLGRLVRSYPHVPGIDFAGRVETSDHPDYKPGDKVILTGWRVGELHWGGYAEKARVKAGWLVPLPEGLTTRQAMAIGTAGLTAMLAVLALEREGFAPETEGDILVTGASGGVGSIAVAILARLGYRVAALTGRAESHDYLRALGAATLIDRAELAEPSSKPLESERWLAAIDTVGGGVLARLLTQLRYRGAVAAVGNAGGVKLETSVLPFILRGVRLIGVDSVVCPRTERLAAWRRLLSDLPLDKLESATAEAGLSELPALADRILKGQVRGRLVIDPRK